MENETIDKILETQMNGKLDYIERIFEDHTQNIEDLIHFTLESIPNQVLDTKLNEIEGIDQDFLKKIDQEIINFDMENNCRFDFFDENYNNLI